MGIKLKGLTLGDMGIDRELLVFPHPKYMLSASRREGRKVWCECPAISYLIEHPDGLVLWETGIATTFAAEWTAEWQELIDMSAITPAVCLEARLRSLGIGPEDVKYVIQGHLHCDHAGGLRSVRDDRPPPSSVTRRSTSSSRRSRRPISSTRGRTGTSSAAAGRRRPTAIRRS